MALEIRENRGIFEVLGSITTQNLAALRIYFQNILEELIEFEFPGSEVGLTFLFLEHQHKLYRDIFYNFVQFLCKNRTGC